MYGTTGKSYGILTPATDGDGDRDGDRDGAESEGVSVWNVGIMVVLAP